MTRQRRADCALRLALVAVTVTGAATGCGGHAAPTATERAMTDARQACTVMLDLGATVYAGHSVLSKTAAGVLDRAHVDADTAYQLDRRWSGLMDSIRIIRASLLTDQRAELQPTLDDFAVECEPALGVSPGA